VTLRQLLSHTSGLPSDEQWPAQVPPTREGIVGEFATMPITAQPGTRFQYCSRCIVLAAYVLERITGQSWEAYTKGHIFEPLGMTTASFGPLGLEQAPDRAQPYRHDAVLDEVTVPLGRLQYLNSLAPAGGIDANVDEMARYALLQLDDGTLSGRRVVSSEMMAELHRPQIVVGADWTPSARVQNLHYALGWFTADVRGGHLVYHNGINPGFRATIVLAPYAKAGVVVLTNGESDPLYRSRRSGPSGATTPVTGSQIKFLKPASGHEDQFPPPHAERMLCVSGSVHGCRIRFYQRHRRSPHPASNRLRPLCTSMRSSFAERRGATARAEAPSPALTLVTA
jgi:CubicO group peptidase (beta-lactamase class C family)